PCRRAWLSSLPRPAFLPPPPSAVPASPAPVWPRESSSVEFRAAATLPVTHRPVDLPRTARPLRHPSLRLAPATPALRPGFAAPSPSSGHSSWLCVCWHWSSLSCHPTPPAPVSSHLP